MPVFKLRVLVVLDAREPKLALFPVFAHGVIDDHGLDPESFEFSVSCKCLIHIIVSFVSSSSAGFLRRFHE